MDGGRRRKRNFGMLFGESSGGRSAGGWLISRSLRGKTRGVKKEHGTHKEKRPERRIFCFRPFWLFSAAVTVIRVIVIAAVAIFAGIVVIRVDFIPSANCIAPPFTGVGSSWQNETQRFRSAQGNKRLFKKKSSQNPHNLYFRIHIFNTKVC